MPAIAPSPISVRKYRRTRYRPDRHFVDGYLEKRNLGDSTHGRTQAVLAGWSGENRHAWNIYAAISLRIQVSPTRIRVCDFCVFSADAPREQVVLTPPLLCIETVSPKDRFAPTISLCEDYLSMGVQNVWLINPYNHTAYTYTSAGLLRAADRLAVPHSNIYLDLPTLFADLD